MSPSRGSAPTSPNTSFDSGGGGEDRSPTYPASQPSFLHDAASQRLNGGNILGNNGYSEPSQPLYANAAPQTNLINNGHYINGISDTCGNELSPSNVLSSSCQSVPGGKSSTSHLNQLRGAGNCTTSTGKQVNGGSGATSTVSHNNTSNIASYNGSNGRNGVSGSSIPTLRGGNSGLLSPTSPTNGGGASNKSFLSSTGRLVNPNTRPCGPSATKLASKSTSGKLASTAANGVSRASSAGVLQPRVSNSSSSSCGSSKAQTAAGSGKVTVSSSSSSGSLAAATAQRRRSSLTGN